MRSAEFQAGIFEALRKKGFETCGESAVKNLGQISVLVSPDKGLGKQWHVNVGLWLNDIGKLETDRYEKTHLYFRLERLLPDYRRTILSSGALSEAGQFEDFQSLKNLIEQKLDAALKDFDSLTKIRAKLKDGSLDRMGFVRADARTFLLSA